MMCRNPHPAEFGGLEKVMLPDPYSQNKTVQEPAGTVEIIGVPMDLGAGRRGVDMGPSALRIAGLHRRLTEMGLSVIDGGNLVVRIPEELPREPGKQIYLEEIARVCRGLSDWIEECLNRRSLPLVLGGDHSIAVGSVSGTAAYFHRKKKKIGLIWIDAHTDFNTPESSPSGNVHGMPLAALMGLGPGELTSIGGCSPKIDVRNTIVVGVRSVDRRERENIKQTGLRVVTMEELDKRGMRSVMEEALAVASEGTAGYHCSFDLDVVDPQTSPGVGTPVQGGITYRESHLAMEMIGESRNLLSLDFVEVNPILDTVNTTGRLAVELICSALGAKIL